MWNGGVSSPLYSTEVGLGQAMVMVLGPVLRAVKSALWVEQGGCESSREGLTIDRW